MRFLLWLLTICSTVGVAHAQAELQPFVATYAVTYRGIEAGTLTMELRHDPQTNQYTFETRANPSVLARLVIGKDAIERSVLESTPDGLRPLHWQLEDGKSSKSGDGDLKFDWTANTVTGDYEGNPVNLQIQPGMQDRLSIQIAVSDALVRGREPGSIVMVNGDRIREYSYARGANASIDSNLGKLDTIVYESTRPGSDRVSKVWHAPSKQFLPARAEQIRKGKVETVMVLVALTDSAK